MTYQAQIAALEAALPDLIDGGEWMVKATETQDTLADFEAAAKGYAESSAKILRGEVAGLSFISWKMVQVRKGDQRRSLTVIDFGDRRVATDADADDWDL